MHTSPLEGKESLQSTLYKTRIHPLEITPSLILTALVPILTPPNCSLFYRSLPRFILMIML